MIFILLAEGLVLGALLVLYCLIGIRRGAVGMVFLYHKEVQDRAVELGLTTYETIKRRALIFKLGGIATYIAYVLLCVYLINGTRGFLPGFLQMFSILFVCNLVDRLLVDGWWVGHTKTWIIPGTEEFMPYIGRNDKIKKWIFGTVGMAIYALALAGIMTIFLP